MTGWWKPVHLRPSRPPPQHRNPHRLQCMRCPHRQLCLLRPRTVWCRPSLADATAVAKGGRVVSGREESKPTKGGGRDEVLRPPGEAISVAIVRSSWRPRVERAAGRGPRARGTGRGRVPRAAARAKEGPSAIGGAAHRRPRPTPTRRASASSSFLTRCRRWGVHINPSYGKEIGGRSFRVSSGIPPEPDSTAGRMPRNDSLE